MLVLLGCFAVIALCVAAFTPRSSEVEGSTLRVKSLLFTFRFELADAVEVREVSERDLAQWKTLRVFGIGWPLQPVGWFFNRRLGLFLNMADNRQHMYLIRFSRIRLLVSSALPGGFERLGSVQRKD